MNYSDMNDSALMLRFKDGDTEAFEFLFARYLKEKKRFKLLAAKPELADEFFQETWEKIIKAKSSYQASASFKTFFNTVLSNVVASHYRKMANKEGLHIPGDAALSEDSDDTHFDELMSNSDSEVERQSFLSRCVELLKAAITQLPLDQRHSLLLKLESGFGIDEIAQVTKVKRETAKSRLRYGLKKLRETVPPDCYE